MMIITGREKITGERMASVKKDAFQMHIIFYGKEKNLSHLIPIIFTDWYYDPLPWLHWPWNIYIPVYTC